MAGIGPVRAGGDVQREAGGDRPDGVQLPAAYDAAGETVIEVLAAFAYGKIIEHRGDKAMACVKDRQAALAAHARPVLGLKLIAAEDADAAAIVDGLGKRVAGEKRKAARHPARHFGRK